ncbi:MAG: pyridoxal phosphate-dependent aminotransferase [Ignavibacteriales bacterium]|nr:pyridoxal phosphate-dependent aminotransferase [Ignavibacteriales bacterium]
MISNKINKLVYSPTMKIAAEAKLLIENGEDIIDLTVGEPDLPTPQNIKDAGIKAIQNNFTKYTTNVGTIELRKAICEKLKNDNSLYYSPDEIIVSNGAKQSIFTAIQTVVDADDEVIFSSPYYVSYPEMVKIAGGVSVIIPTDESTEFKITPKQLDAAITSKTKLLIICNPSNPTGSVYSKEELIELAEVIRNKNILILSDEIYEKLVYDDFKYFSFASIDENIKERTITINGCSKTYSMTGWRIGYTAANKEIINAMAKYQSHNTGNASSISQLAALEALTGIQDSVSFAQNEFEKRRNYFWNELISIEGISCYKPKGAFYFFPNVQSLFGKSVDSFVIQNSIDFSTFLLRYAKVATVPGIGFGAEGYIRISYSSSIEKLKLATERIKEAVKKLK